MNDKKKQLYLDFEAYERVAEPHKREKAEAWRAAIGLQDVDGLKVSEYLKETAAKHTLRATSRLMMFASNCVHTISTRQPTTRTMWRVKKPTVWQQISPNY